MHKLIAIIKLNIILLIRDKMALLILFVLPVCLVLVMTLIQSNLGGQHKNLKLLVAIKSKTRLNRSLAKSFTKNDFFAAKVLNKTTKKEINQVKQKVAQGDYRALVVLPRNPNTPTQLYLDPTMPADMTNSLVLAVRYILQSANLQLATQVLNRSGNKRNLGATKIFEIKKSFVSTSGKSMLPNAAQQNVPAWALFGMFLILVPLASQMVRERESMQQRLRVTPTSPVLFLLGRNITYIFLNLLQLILMLAVGIYILPKLGVSGLVINSKWYLILLIGLGASLAATGFGIFIGAWCKTQQQVTAVGPFIIVIVAAISGIFVPTYLMPNILKLASNFSPMFWAQQGFLDIFVRNAGFGQILAELFKLVGFFLLMLLLALPKMYIENQR